MALLLERRRSAYQAARLTSETAPLVIGTLSLAAQKELHMVRYSGPISVAIAHAFQKETRTFTNQYGITEYVQKLDRISEVLIGLNEKSDVGVSVMRKVGRNDPRRVEFISINDDTRINYERAKHDYLLNYPSEIDRRVIETVEQHASLLSWHREEFDELDFANIDSAMYTCAYIASIAPEVLKACGVSYFEGNPQSPEDLKRIYHLFCLTPDELLENRDPETLQAKILGIFAAQMVMKVNDDLKGAEGVDSRMEMPNLARWAEKRSMREGTTIEVELSALKEMYTQAAENGGVPRIVVVAGATAQSITSALKEWFSRSNIIAPEDPVATLPDFHERYDSSIRHKLEAAGKI